MRIKQLFVMTLVVLSVSLIGINHAAAQNLPWWNQTLDKFLDDYLSTYNSRTERPSLIHFHNYLKSVIAYANGVAKATEMATVAEVDSMVEAYNNLNIEEAYINQMAVWATDVDSIELIRQAREAIINAKKAIKSRLLVLGVSLDRLPDGGKLDGPMVPPIIDNSEVETK